MNTIYTLNEYILDFSGKEDSRALVFVKTRELTVALERFFKEDFDMIDNKLTVGRFVGSGASEDEGGMFILERGRGLIDL